MRHSESIPTFTARPCSAFRFSPGSAGELRLGTPRRSTRRPGSFPARWTVLASLLALSCGGDDEQVEGTGQACQQASECYADLEEEVQGTPECLDVSGGYCTHSCARDADCCAVAGECDYGDRGELIQVCAPFTSTSGNWCFLSCEDDALAGVPEEDRATFCQDISPDLNCRATGGGDPKKACLPGG